MDQTELSKAIREYIDNPKCTVILFENPPYAETTSVEHQKKGVGAKSSSWKQSYVVGEMKKEVKGTASNDLGNAFLWSELRRNLLYAMIISPYRLVFLEA